MTATDLAAPPHVDAVPRRGVVGWWRNPWRKPRILLALTLLYIGWSLLPVLIAVVFSFNAGRSTL